MKLTSQYIEISRDKGYFDSWSNVRSCYYLLKDIRDTSALLDIRDWYMLCETLLKKFKISSFYFELPLQNRKMVMEGYHVLLREFFPASKESRQILEREKAFQILVIDDDVWFVDWVIEALDGSDSDIHFVQASPNQVMEMLLFHDFSSVLVNMALPNQKGFKIVEEIREKDEFSTLPILAYTHIDDEHHHREALETGVDVIIRKPFSSRILESYLHYLVKRQIRLLHAESLKSISVQKVEMQALIEKEWVRFQRFHSYFSILMIKIDSSMVLIENLGLRAVFDFVNEVQQTLRQSVRIYDEIRRWSPDTFLLLLPATRIEGAMIVGKRLLQRIEKSVNQVDIASHLYIAAIESEIGYKDVNHMILCLNRELMGVTPNERLYRVPPLLQLSDQKGIKKRMILIDDDLVTPSIIQNHLKQEEWDIEVCIGGSEAINLTLTFQPDVIICESILKELDGFTFCTQIKEFPQFKHTVFIFLTKQSLTKNVIRGIDAGADDYMTKPFSVQELEARISRHLLNKQGRT